MIRTPDDDRITPRDLLYAVVAPLLVGVAIEVTNGVVEHIRKRSEPKPPETKT